MLCPKALMRQRHLSLKAWLDCSSRNMLFVLAPHPHRIDHTIPISNVCNEMSCRTPCYLYQVNNLVKSYFCYKYRAGIHTILAFYMTILSDQLQIGCPLRCAYAGRHIRIQTLCAYS